MEMRRREGGVIWEFIPTRLSGKEEVKLDQEDF
jgi:hypothetical protein